MAARSESYLRAFIASLALSGASASPFAHHIGSREVAPFEWTAFGDSYASGVGAGEYISNSYRCLRYDHAYPMIMNTDPRLPAGDHIFHNVVCSGSSTADVEAYQFYDEDTSGKPNWQYGDRPKFGDPQMGTLSVGGNDIDFPGIIFNCILEWNLPGGSEQRSCDEQKQVSWNLLLTPDLADKIDHTIKKIVERGRKGKIGDDFKLYVIGFPQFFDVTTDECDKVTFARSANPKDDGKEHTRMTQDLRKEFNSMSVQLNKAIEEAATRNKDQGVTWIPIDGEMAGHRYCEPGITEPDQQNPNLWVAHYPYNEPEDPDDEAMLQKARDKLTANGADINTAYKTFNDYQNALFDAVEEPSDLGIQDPLWSRLGPRFKVFHPQNPLHDKIRDLVLDAYSKDSAGDSSGGGGGSTDPPVPETNTCHGVSGDTWVMSRDVAVGNADDFCKQGNKQVTYNQGSVNELSLSVRNLKDDSKGPTDAPDCSKRFRDVVIDSCDGNDPINNPHNYKFGSNFTSSDGWEYIMTPLSKQVNEVSCDVAYKFFFDSFEIRGKNLPDAKFGANGEGLKSQVGGCGAITKWNFELTPNDVKFQWYASGQLPIGTKACVGRALQSAGGSGTGNCNGAGKRSNSAVAPRRSYGIEDWPGYGDEGKHVFREPASE